MLHNILCLLLFFSLLLPLPGRTQLLQYQLDTAQSRVEWTGRKILGKHQGTVQIEKGSLLWEQGKISQGNFVLDMRTLQNKDLKPKRRKKLEKWLKSEEMFYVEQHPYVNFQFTQAVPMENNQYKITGKLTIKDITHEISFPARVRRTDRTLEADASITFDRTQWNLHYEGGIFGGIGDAAIRDEVSIEVHLQATASTR